MTNPIDKVFDSRELIQYVEEIKDEILAYYNDYIDDVNKEHEDDDDWTGLDNKDDYDELNDDDFNTIESIHPKFYNDYGYEKLEDLQELFNFYDELSQYGDFKYGETIIREDYWVEYCEDLCINIGEIPKDLPWYIANHIDWKGVAEEIAMDYTYATYDGEDYYIRNC